MQHYHRADNHRDGAGPTEANFPFDPRTGEAMQNVKPYDENGRDDVGPIGNGADAFVVDLEIAEARQD